MKRCPKNCKSCDMCNIKTSSNNNDHIIPFCFECIKFGITGDNFSELYQNVLEEKENA